ncbi:hypothetical protein I317_03122 [Kwoniella heveanensis CBS 569]|nr:hypothetical protein I317_03122 [Kwoniella heveanensis CBS 569]
MPLPRSPVHSPRPFLEGNSYYDVGDQSGCGSVATDPVPAGWAVGINGGTPYCEQQRGFSLNQIGSNAIVAFDQDKVWADPATWCGRGVRLWKPDGTEYISPDGPLYIWDSCAACAGGGAILDVSGPTFVDVKGGTCGGNNPTGITYEVLDTYVVDPSVGLRPSGAGGAISSSAQQPPSPPAVSTDFGIPTSPVVGTEGPGGSTGGGGVGAYPSTSVAGPVDGGYPPSSAASVQSPPDSPSPYIPSSPPVIVPTSPTVSLPPSQPPVNSVTQAPPVNPATQATPVIPATPVPSSPPTTTPVKNHGGWGGWGGKHNWGQGSDGALAAFAEEGVESIGTGAPAQCRRRKRRRLSKYH